MSYEPGTPYDAIVDSQREAIAALQEQVGALHSSRKRQLEILRILWWIQMVTAVVAIIALIGAFS